MKRCPYTGQAAPGRPVEKFEAGATLVAAVLVAGAGADAGDAVGAVGAVGAAAAHVGFGFRLVVHLRAYYGGR